MSWQTELIPASYQGFSFETNDFSISQGKKGAIEEIANGDGAAGQDLGNTSRIIDIDVFFIDDNYKSLRDAFELLLQIPLVIPGVLLLPTRNFQFSVRPVSWVVNENVDKRGGRADVRVRFREVLAEVFPLAVISQALQITSAVSGAGTKIIDDSTDAVNYGIPILTAQSQRDFTSYFDKVNTFIRAITDVSLIPEFETQLAVLEENQNDLIADDPETLFASYNSLISFPAKKVTAFTSVFQNYQLFIDSINATFDQTLTTLAKKNQSHQIEAITSFAFISIVEAANSIDYTTRNQLLTALDNIRDNEAGIQVTLDALENLFDNELSTSQYRQSKDTSDSRKDLLASITEILLQTLFTLPNEKIIILDRPRSILSLSFDLFGSVENDEKIDELINNNSIIDPTLIPFGTRLVYYE